MSLTPAFAPDTKSQWQELEAELQELVLDELDAIATNPPRSREGEIRRDTVHETANARDYLFLRFVSDETRATLIGIYDHVAPLPSGGA